MCIQGTPGYYSDKRTSPAASARMEVVSSLHPAAELALP